LILVLFFGTICSGGASSSQVAKQEISQISQKLSSTTTGKNHDGVGANHQCSKKHSHPEAKTLRACEELMDFLGQMLSDPISHRLKNYTINNNMSGSNDSKDENWECDHLFSCNIIASVKNKKMGQDLGFSAPGAPPVF